LIPSTGEAIAAVLKGTAVFRSVVMTGLVPGIHVFKVDGLQKRGWPDKPGDDMP